MYHIIYIIILLQVFVVALTAKMSFLPHKTKDCRQKKKVETARGTHGTSRKHTRDARNTAVQKIDGG